MDTSNDGATKVLAADGETKFAAEWVGKDGRSRKLRGATIAGGDHPVGAVVCVHAKGMKESWCLAISDEAKKPKKAIDYYGMRWIIEPSFRDTKDLRFRMGLSHMRVSTPERRDRLLFLNAIAINILTILGAAGESLGMDRQLKSNTSKRRTHSFLKPIQGDIVGIFLPLVDRINEGLRSQPAM